MGGDVERAVVGAMQRCQVLDDVEAVEQQPLAGVRCGTGCRDVGGENALAGRGLDGPALVFVVVGDGVEVREVVGVWHCSRFRLGRVGVAARAR
ncbi:hypothetical protein GCM10009753_07140 [Streptantibioticus ferralitis]